MPTRRAGPSQRSQLAGLTSAPLMVVHPALSSPPMPSAVKALLITSPQKGATSSDQSAVLMSAQASAWGMGGGQKLGGCL